MSRNGSVVARRENLYNLPSLRAAYRRFLRTLPHSPNQFVEMTKDIFLT